MPPPEATMPDGIARLSWWQRTLLHLWACLTRHRDATLNSGAWGERWAERFLRIHGCTILARNARPFRRGEVDLIARHKGILLFVEVKTRKSETYGRPLLAVNKTKRQLLRKSATHWLSRRHLLGTDTLYRFDAIEVVGTPSAGLPKIHWQQRLNMTDAPTPNHL